ncbi:MAG: protein kinase [Chloroflexota bacterium]
MLSLADESTPFEEPQTESLLDNAVTIVQDRSSTLYLEQDPTIDLPIFLEVSNTSEADDAKALAQFQKQAQMLTQLQHPNIVPILDAGATPDNRFYTAIEHFTSVTLTQKLVELNRSATSLPAESALALVNQLADALGTLHALGTIHQDLRPEKILLNEHNQPLLAGFTVTTSPVLTRDTIRDLVPVNELDFESPEQAMGDAVTESSNVYSLGILLYTLFAGHPPRLPIGQWQVADTPQSSREIPLTEVRSGLAKETYALVQKCMASNPAERYQTMPDLQADIQMAMMAEQVSTDRKVVQITKQDKPKKQLPLWGILSLAALLIAVVLGAAFFISQGLPPGETETVAEADGGAAAVIVSGPTATPTATIDFEATAVVIAEQQTATAESIAATATQAAADAIAEATAEAIMIAETVAAEEAMAEPTATMMPEPTMEPTVVAEAEAEDEASADEEVTMADESTVAEVSCDPQATILVVYPHEDPNHNLTHTNIFFPLNFDLKNSGDCPIPGDAQLVHVDGEAFGFEGNPVLLENPLAHNQAQTLRVILSSPEEAGEYSSTWQLVDDNNNPISDPFTFQVRTYIPEEGVGEAAEGETATTVVETLALDWYFRVDGDSCEMIDQDWRCQVMLTPYGGSGGPYQLLIFDQPAGQATTLEGIGTFAYHAVSTRCDVYSQEIKIIDQVTGNTLSSKLTIDPNSFFDCTTDAG